MDVTDHTYQVQKEICWFASLDVFLHLNSQLQEAWRGDLQLRNQKALS